MHNIYDTRETFIKRSYVLCDGNIKAFPVVYNTNVENVL